MLKFKAKSYFLSLILILIIMNLVVLLDVPVLRQIFGFVFLTFVPGFFLLYLLKLNKLNLVDKIVLSVGLSIAFLMLFGLLINSLLLAIGYSRPLSTTSLLISFSTVTIILAIVAYIRDKGITLSFSSFKLTNGEKAFLIVPSLFPLLSIAGMRLMNLTDNNVLLMFLLFLIPAYVIFISFSNRRVSERVYPVAIFLIAISLLLMYSLRSNHIIDGDTHREYFMFLTILDNRYWSQLGFSVLDACLSVTMLPAIYQTFLNINPEYLYKLIFSVVASILPLAVYLLSKKYIGSFYSFLASVFFMSQITFLGTPAYNRTVIAILFFALAIWVLFHDNINELSKRALFIVFIVATILSHYGVTWATFFLLLLTWIGMQILPRIVFSKEELAPLATGNPVIEGDSSPALPHQGNYPHGSDSTADKVAALEPSQTRLRRGVTLASIAIFLTVLFFWYSQMTGPSFEAGVSFTYDTITGWRWFLAEEAATGQAVQTAFGETPSYWGVAQRIEFVFSWLTIIFIATGVLNTIRIFKVMVSTPRSEGKKPDFMQKKFEVEYLILSIACCLMLIATVLLPVISRYYGEARTYFQMVVPLSIFFIIGGITVAKYLKLRPYWVLLVVLIPYFLCTTGAMTQVFGFPRVITLNSEGPLYQMYIFDGESSAAKWIGEYGEEGVTIYTSAHAQDMLLSQGGIPYLQTRSTLISRSQENRVIGGYIYLEYLLLGDEGLVAKYPDTFAEKGKIYNSGRSEIYK